MPGLGNAVDAHTTGFQSLNAATGVWNGRTLVAGSGISITNTDGTVGNPTIAAVAGTTGFYAYKSAASANVTGANLNALVIFDTEVSDPGANYNNATGIYTAPSTGIYFFSCNVGFSSINGLANRGTTDFFVNGGARIYGNYQNNFGVIRDVANQLIMGTCAFIDLTAGDTVNVEVNVSGMAGNTVGLLGAANPRETAFGGFRVY